MNPRGARSLRAQCCIAGGGPAGMMLGYLLARAGVETVVLEKHGDFLRDFRGDTVHPSTLAIMDELGLLDKFLRIPHQTLTQLTGVVGGETLKIADFGRLRTRCPFVAFLPQWDFLDFLAAQGKVFPNLTVLMNSRVDKLLWQGKRVVGVGATGPEGAFEVRAALTVGADGRGSTVRTAARLPVTDLGAPIDVLWFRIGRKPATFDDAFTTMAPGKMLITLDRGDYWQCAYVIAKGSHETVRAAGIAAFRAQIVKLAPKLGRHIDDLQSFDDVKLLSVSVNRLRRWSRPGLLCIGDAAHAMSPVGGVGINLAIQDAVATANVLAVKLRNNSVSERDLLEVRRRRLWPAATVQAGQVQIHELLLKPVLGSAVGELRPPLPLKLLDRCGPLRGLLARLVGIGVRPEHVRSPAVTPGGARD